MSISTRSANILTQNEAVDLTRFRTVSLDETSLYRLIPSRFPPVDLYERIAPSSTWDALYEIESKTNPRLRRQDSSEENVGSSQNWNQAPFAYPQPKGSLFTKRHDTSLIMFATQEAALAVSLRQRTDFLSEGNLPSTEVITRLLITPVTGRFLDVRGDDLNSGDNEFDPKLLAESCRHTEGVDGIAFRNPAYLCADAYLILRKSALGHTKQGSHFAYRWDGEQFTNVRDSSGSNDPRENAIDIETLMTGKSVLYRPS